MASDDLPHSEEYLTYRPLSNLPTPPPSSRQSSSSLSSCAGLEDGEPLRPSLRGELRAPESRIRSRARR